MAHFNKKTIVWSLIASFVACFGLYAALSDGDSRLRAGTTYSKSCAGIYFGTANSTSTNTLIATNTSSKTYYTVTSGNPSFGVSSLSGVSKAYRASNSSYSMELYTGSKSSSSSVTFNFNGSYIVTQAKITARLYSSSYSGAIKLTMSNGSSKTATVSGTTTPTLSDTADASTGLYTFSSLDGGASTPSTYFTLASNTTSKVVDVYIYKIVLTLAVADDSGTSTSSSNATSSSDSGTTSSSSTTYTDPIVSATKTSTYNYETVANAEGAVTFPGLNGTHTSQKLLVLPLTVKGFESNATEANRTNIQKMLFGAASDTGWQSLSSYYSTSSYGALTITGTVAPWYACGLTADQIVNKNDSSATEVVTLINAAVANYKTVASTKCTEFDQNSDGYIDGVMVIYSCPNYSSTYWDTNADSTVTGDTNGTFWAFTYNCYDNTSSTTSPVASKFFWASYDFMFEGYGTSSLDAHTFIHESGHMMGLDDYYSYDTQSAKASDGNTYNFPTRGAMGAVDMMDYNVIDHNAFSKFALGWQSAKVISGTQGSLTVTLKPAATNSGECLILPTVGGFNGTAFDEYIIMEYYTPTGLNEKDSTSAYTNGIQGFTENGVRIYHVDARLFKPTSYSSTTKLYSGSYTNTVTAWTSSAYGSMVAHSNSTSRSYVNSNFRLIQEIDHAGRNFDSTYTGTYTTSSGTTITGPKTYVADNDTLFQAGDTFSFSSFASQFYSSTAMNDGTKMRYSVSFANMSSTGIDLTVTYA